MTKDVLSTHLFVLVLILAFLLSEFISDTLKLEKKRTAYDESYDGVEQ